MVCLCDLEIRNFPSTRPNGENRDCILPGQAGDIVAAQQVVTAAVAEFERQIFQRRADGDLDRSACMAARISRPWATSGLGWPF